tara:strand:- start:257 stop:691 length:435 start_codon:yes stop_codon:yes gene_type:complete
MTQKNKIRGMAWATDRAWTTHQIINLVLNSELIAASKREPNPYALGHFLLAAEKIQETIEDGAGVEDLRRLRTEIEASFLLPLTRFYRWLDAVTEHTNDRRPRGEPCPGICVPIAKFRGTRCDLCGDESNSRWEPGLKCGRVED